MLALGLGIGCTDWIGLWENNSTVCRNLAEWILFLILQFSLFASQYGKADCYCFSSCGFLLFLKGGGIFEDLIMMVLALFLLFLVQLKRKNIALKGALLKPVPFVPYIAAGFFIVLVWICIDF